MDMGTKTVMISPGKREDKMAQEIIAAVRKAEILAEETEQKALAESAAIRQQSQNELASIVSERINSEKHQAEAALAEAKALGDQWLRDAEAAAEIEIIQLQEMAKQEEAAMISLILDELI